jgi:hypothetical protein
MHDIRNHRLSEAACSTNMHVKAVTSDHPLQPRFMHGIHATGSPTMNQDLLNGTRNLAKGNVRHLHAERGRRVEVMSGAIWITQDGDPRDIVLQDGDAFDFDRAGDALLSAFADSRYLVLDAVGRH